jgi:stress-induced morphogen
MPVSLEELEEILRNALPIYHLEIHDQSSGCGENYAILVVSEVNTKFAAFRISSDSNAIYPGIRWKVYPCATPSK